MTKRPSLARRYAAASLCALSLVGVADAALAQAGPDTYAAPETAPASDQYQPSRAAQPYNPDYANQYADWQRRYADWSARYCVNQRSNNAAAGAVIGGVMGAFLGAGVAGWGNRTGGAIVGGAVGATAGAAIGANSGPPAGCPAGYVVRQGAPVFYAAPYYPPPVVYARPVYNPWVWVNGAWVYRPYRYGYPAGPRYWRAAPYAYRAW